MLINRHEFVHDWNNNKIVQNDSSSSCLQINVCINEDSRNQETYGEFKQKEENKSEEKEKQLKRICRKLVSGWQRLQPLFKIH